MPRSTQPLRDAIAEYDRTQPERDSALAFIHDQESADVYLLLMEPAALFKVRQAFFEVTCDRNSFNNCMDLVDLKFMRKIAEMDELADLP